MRGKIFLDNGGKIIYHTQDLKISHGGVAQLGERLNGIQEVRGSIPLVSTISKMN